MPLEKGYTDNKLKTFKTIRCIIIMQTFFEAMCAQLHTFDKYITGLSPYAKVRDMQKGTWARYSLQSIRFN